METNEMGRVTTEVIVENLKDLWAAQEGRCLPERVRRVTITDALVDTGATTLALPRRLIGELGLSKRYEKMALSSRGKSPVNVYDAMRITIQGRHCTVDVMEVPGEVPALIGQIPLGMLDLVIDPRGRCLTGNPAHGGEHVLELF